MWLFVRKAGKKIAIIAQKRSFFSTEYPFAVKLASKTFPMCSGAFWTEYIWNDGPVGRAVTYALSHFSILHK